MKSDLCFLSCDTIDFFIIIIIINAHLNLEQNVYEKLQEVFLWTTLLLLLLFHHFLISQPTKITFTSDTIN